MATVSVIQKIEADVQTLQVEAGVRYWEDGEVNGVEDEDGKLMPFASGDMWRPRIDLDSGTVLDWPAGITAKTHYKVCDAGVYTLLNSAGEQVRRIDGYVPELLSPGGNGYGDYIIMSIDEAGKIENWSLDLSAFESEEE